MTWRLLLPTIGICVLFIALMALIAYVEDLADRTSGQRRFRCALKGHACKNRPRTPW